MAPKQGFDVSTLNPEQRRAVEQTEGRVLVLAVAGSGKTRVLTFRMAHLIENLGASPDEILGLTFTNKAAEEMRRRMADLIGAERAQGVTLRTFHGLCMQILRQEIHHLGFTNQFTLYDEQDVTRMVKLIARDELDHEGDLPSVNGLINTISFARNRGMSPKELPATGNDWLDKFSIVAFERLENAFKAYNAVDFDSLLTLTVRLFREHPDVLARYQERFRYILIDEYQDTNPIQYQIASLLSAGHGNLCVVGDDDQSIYGWRGADVQNILNFENATAIKLEQNYRSTNNILKAANGVISKNPDRFEKALWSERGDGQKIEVFIAPNEEREAEAVVYRLMQLKKNAGLQWKDFAILYRSNALSRLIEQELLKQHWADGHRWIRGIPYQIFGGTAFYERKEVKDLMAYLRIIANPRDQEAILRVINQPRRGIGEMALNTIREHSKSSRYSLWQAMDDVADLNVSTRGKGGVNNFLASIRSARAWFNEMPMHEAMERFIEQINFKQAIAEDVKSEKMRAFKWENVQELINALAEYEAQKAALGEDSNLVDFLSTATLLRDDMKREKKGGMPDAVNLMTIHSAKGLEFPACFLIGLEDHIIPHQRSLDDGTISEERRLMYVGVTRARDYLTCSAAATRKRMGRPAKSQPSRFMHDLPRELLHVTKWDGV